jgi:hypothetical protein
MTYRHCQSCGMPLSKDPHRGGAEADGSTSATYCSHCYRDGAFTRPDISALEMQELARHKLKEMGIPGLIAWFFVRDVPKLKRWSAGT